jgi:DNA-binding beta-propeller fold protein YncE
MKNESLRRYRSGRNAKRSRLLLVGCCATALLFAVPAPAIGAITAGVGAASAPSSPAPGTQLWVNRFSGPSFDSFDIPDGLAVSRNGDRVFATGNSSGEGAATVAYNAADGHQQWAVFSRGETASAIGVSPDGTKVFVTGYQLFDVATDYDYATVAYDAANGHQLWVARYNGPTNGPDFAQSLGVSPDGTTVFVTGASGGSTTNEDYATVAYNAANGTRLWAKRYNGPANNADRAWTVGVSPDGTKVFVAGFSVGATGSLDYATLAYNAANGTQLWAQRYNGPANGDDFPHSLGISPDGTKIFVTGYSVGSTSGLDYATVAYNAARGTELWVARYNGPANGYDEARSLGISPDGSKVFVTGISEGSTSGSPGADYGTVAYDAANGTQRWVARYNGPASSNDGASSVGVSPSGDKIFVSGGSNGGPTAGTDYATVAYTAANGTQLWVARYNGPANGTDDARGLVVSPDGSTVFVTGASYTGGDGSAAYATVAYAVSSHRPHIFEVVIKLCRNLHVGYNYFPAGTVVHWNLSQAGVKVVSGQQFTTLGGGRTYHFLTMPLGVTLQPEATAGEAKVRFSWTINGVLFKYGVQRDPGC